MGTPTKQTSGLLSVRFVECLLLGTVSDFEIERMHHIKILQNVSIIITKQHTPNTGVKIQLKQATQILTVPDSSLAVCQQLLVLLAAQLPLVSVKINMYIGEPRTEKTVLKVPALAIAKFTRRQFSMWKGHFL